MTGGRRNENSYTCNANRLRDNDLMREVVEEMNRRKVHIVIWTETHFEQKHSIEFEKITEKKGYKTYSVARWMKRYDSGSGGVTIMIDKQFQSKERKKSKMEDMWTWESVYSASVVVKMEKSGGSSGRNGEGYSSIYGRGASSCGRRLELQNWKVDVCC